MSPGLTDLSIALAAQRLHEAVFVFLVVFVVVADEDLGRGYLGGYGFLPSRVSSTTPVGRWQ